MLLNNYHENNTYITLCRIILFKGFFCWGGDIIKKYYATLSAIIIILLVFSTSNARAYTYYDISSLKSDRMLIYPDASGITYIASQSDGYLHLKYIKGGSSNDFSFFTDYLKLEAISGCNRYIGAVLSGTNITHNELPVRQLQVLIYNFSSEQCDINTVMSAIDNESCFAMGRSCFYMLQNDSHTIKVFSFDGTPKYSISTQYNLLRLLYDSSADRLYALSDRQIFSVNGRSVDLLGDISSPALIAGAGAICSNDGAVYSAGNNALTYLCRVPRGKGAAVVGNIIYYCDDKVLYGVNRSGEKIYSLDIGWQIERVFPHGSSIGIICANGELMIISPSEMNEIPRETQPVNNGSASSGSPPHNTSSGASQNSSSSGGSSNNSTNNSSSGSSNTSSRPSSGSISSSVYTLNKSNMTISGIAPQTSIAKFKQNMNYSGYSVLFRNYGGASKTSGNVGTGFTAQFYAQQQLSFTLIVNGDLTGEGNINSLDVKKYMQFLCGKIDLDSPFYSAADMNRDGACDTLDLLAAAKY